MVRTRKSLHRIAQSAYAAGLCGGCVEQGAGRVVSWLRAIDLTQHGFGRKRGRR